jgi:hypothetical protein
MDFAERPFAWGKGWSKKRSADNRSADVFDADGTLVRREYYEDTGEFVAGVALVNVKVVGAEGELICRHTDRPVSDTAYDIQVTDASGKLRGIIHHRDVDRGEPFTISEEWFAPETEQ